LATLPLPPSEPPANFPAGEAEALRRLQRFLDGPIAAYADGRNRLDTQGTSQLSPYLRFGMISARQAVVAALQSLAGEGGKGAEVWLSELIWREFYVSILYHFPQVLERSFRVKYEAIPWHNDPADFAAWQSGHTGYPIVDAAMRQLQATGWMHNRARMIVASFFVKDLLIDWRWGERWFMQQLVDGDPAATHPDRRRESSNLPCLSLQHLEQPSDAADHPEQHEQTHYTVEAYISTPRVTQVDYTIDSHARCAKSSATYGQCCYPSNQGESLGRHDGSALLRLVMGSNLDSVYWCHIQLTCQPTKFSHVNCI